LLDYNTPKDQLLAIQKKIFHSHDISAHLTITWKDKVCVQRERYVLIGNFTDDGFEMQGPPLAPWGNLDEYILCDLDLDLVDVPKPKKGGIIYCTHIRIANATFFNKKKYIYRFAFSPYTDVQMGSRKLVG